MISKNVLCALVATLLLSTAIAQTASPPAAGWPRHLALNDGAALLYPPQVASWNGSALVFRSALALKAGAKASETFDHLWIFESRLQGCDKLVVHILGQSFRRPHRVPRRDFESGKSTSVERWQIRQRRHFGFRRNGVAFYLAVQNLVRGVCCLIAHEIELSADEIVHRRPRPAISKPLHLNADFLHQYQRAEVGGGAYACVAVGHLPLLRSHPVK